MKNLIFILVLIFLIPFAAAAQGTGFNFQGRLNDGTNPANGSYDLQFRLYDAIAGGNQILATVSRPATTLINGVFSVTLDFGATAFNSPNSVFIEIAVRPNGSSLTYTILGPRQQLTVVPFAVRAATATLADNATNAQNSVNAQNAVTATNSTNAVNAQNSVNATNATTASNALSLGAISASNYARLDFANQGNVLATGLLLTNDARQPVTGNGLVKAMIYVNANMTIIRCYNGITNTSTGNCGFTVTTAGPGQTAINFGFQVSDRFISVTPTVGDEKNIGAGFSFGGFGPVTVYTFRTDQGYNSFTSNAFMIIVF